MLGNAPKNHPHAIKKRGVDDSIDDRETPPCVFVPLDAEFHFTLDVAANHHNAKCALYATLKGLYANIAGRAVAVHEEDEVGGGLPDLDWGQAPEGIWRLLAAPETRAAPMVGPSHHLRLGRRRYTAWDDGVPSLRQPEPREPGTSLSGHERGQHEGLLPEGEGGRSFHEGTQANGALAAEARARRTGLDISWAGHTVFINPPFSGLRPWAEKAWDEESTVVLLLPNNRSEQPFFQKLIEPYRDRAGSILTTRNLAKRRPFLHHGHEIGNRTSKSPPFGLVVVIWDRRRPELRAPAQAVQP